MRYSLWDELVLKVEDNFGYGDKYYASLKVMIIGIDHNSNNDYIEYVCYVPPYETVPHGFETFTITSKHINNLDIEPKFLGDAACRITSRNPIFKHSPATPGCRCSRCQEWFEGVKGDDEGRYTCRSCKENPYR